MRRNYIVNNRGKLNARDAKRYADEVNATPNWFEKEKIKIVYEKAKWLENITGLCYDVDHIIPIKGREVCGLHVWANLQILERKLNQSKGNRMPKKENKNGNE